MTMNGWRLSRQSLRFYWRTQLGVLLGVTCAAMVLVGALAVGDSVRASLREQSLQRIGRIDAALQAGNRFVTEALAERLTTAAPAQTAVPIIALPGVANRADGAARTGIVAAYGVGRRFFAMSPSGRERTIPPGHALVNARLADQLGVEAGDEVVLRIEKPSLMPREATMATVDDLAFALRITVDGVLTDDEFGRFGLQASQIPPFNIFVQREWLQEELELGSRVNLLAVDGAPDAADRALRKHWTLADAELEIRTLPGGEVCELASSRVFLDAPISAAVRELDPTAIGVLTYFVNSITAGDRTTPYSTVSALGPLRADAALAAPLAAVHTLAPPRDAATSGITINRWLADDLRVQAGDAIELAYSVMNSALQFDEQRQELKVHAIVELAGPAADPSLMPPFPGLAEARSCADWEPGIPVELNRLDDADQDYWEEHRGTPKAFVALAKGRELWSNRYGDLTAIRTTLAAGDRLRTELPRTLDPADLGLFFRDVRGPAMAAGAPATDFGGLFLGLSFFLIIASLLLTALLFVFGIEQRHGEVGTLLASGFTPAQVRRQFLREALLTAIVGSLLGGALGLGYAHLVIAGLDTLWRDAIGQTTLTAHTEPLSFAIGTVAAVATALLAILLATRRAFRRPVLELLNGTNDTATAAVAANAAGKPRRLDVVLAAAAVLGALTLGLTAGTGSAVAAGTFFGAGALLLVGALLLCRRLVTGLGNQRSAELPSVLALASRNTGRRSGRSLATIALLASGTFLVVAVQANRLEPPQDPGMRASGTGGFRLFGRSTLPVLRDLATPIGREAYGLDDEELADTSIVPLRVRDGDDGSCLNLNRPQNPRLIGVDPQQLASRGAFRFAQPASTTSTTTSAWNLLDDDLGDDVVPAIGDAASVTWSLHKAVGDSLRYRDEAGDEFDVRIVGTVTDSILQGNLLIADRHLRRRFPSASGFRMFLVDTPPERVETVTATLGRALQDIGLELTPTRERLATFQSVQNTYLAIFQLLGGLGLLLGTAGLGIVVLRNALERRAELATLSAIGFRPAAVRRLVAIEHGVLLGLGLLAGIAAALFAIWPVRDDIAVPPLLLFVCAITGTGAFWVWLASAFATRGALLDALRGE
ncbi:MAG: FtsX-like permease family protein [bacterium]|nr:FtsX-like permease family protein [bacterium]